MRRLDFIIIGAVLLAALLIYLICIPRTGGALRVSVISAGVELRNEELPDEAWDLTVESEYGVNILRIMPDGVQVVWADCASQTCVHTGKITEAGHIIACLPNHLVITLSGEQEVDAVAG